MAAGRGLDVLGEGSRAHALLAAIEQGREIHGLHGHFGFRHVATADGRRPDWARPATDTDATQVRPMGAEQSNSSVVFREHIALKVFRKLEPGINPDLEMLRFLTAHDYPNIAPLYGWYEYEGETLAATLGVAQQFVSGASDGWDLALREIPSEPELFLERIASLGTATARLHSVLATDAGDPAFSPRIRAASSSTCSRRRSTISSRGSSDTCRTTTPASPRSSASNRRFASASRFPRRARSAARASASTAIITSARPCTTSTAGRCSTSRVSRRAR